MQIALGADHAGYQLKGRIKQHLEHRLGKISEIEKEESQSLSSPARSD